MSTLAFISEPLQGFGMVAYIKRKCYSNYSRDTACETCHPRERADTHRSMERQTTNERSTLAIEFLFSAADTETPSLPLQLSMFGHDTHKGVELLASMKSIGRTQFMLLQT